jgi:hypothetical protein
MMGFAALMFAVGIFGESIARGGMPRRTPKLSVPISRPLRVVLILLGVLSMSLGLMRLFHS